MRNIEKRNIVQKGALVDVLLPYQKQTSLLLTITLGKKFNLRS